MLGDVAVAAAVVSDVAVSAAVVGAAPLELLVDPDMMNLKNDGDNNKRVELIYFLLML